MTREIGHFISGKTVAGESKRYGDVFDPNTGEVQAKVAGVKGVSSAHVELVWDPPWDKDMMSEEAQLRLGFM